MPAIKIIGADSSETKLQDYIAYLYESRHEALMGLANLTLDYINDTGNMPDANTQNLISKWFNIIGNDQVKYTNDIKKAIEFIKTERSR